MGGPEWRGEGSGSTRGVPDQYGERRQRGPYSGRGPRNYQRPDERIAEDVCERLTQHGQIDASNVDVTVQHGEVTLKGTVPDRRMKRLAEDVAESVRGVQDVHNELRLANPAQESGQAAPCGEIRPGMEVVGRMGIPIGQIVEVLGAGFVVKRYMSDNVYIPFEQCEQVNSHVQIKLSADEVDNANWSQSP